MAKHWPLSCSIHRQRSFRRASFFEFRFSGLFFDADLSKEDGKKINVIAPGSLKFALLTSRRLQRRSPFQKKFPRDSSVKTLHKRLHKERVLPKDQFPDFVFQSKYGYELPGSQQQHWALFRRKVSKRAIRRSDRPSKDNSLFDHTVSCEASKIFRASSIFRSI